MWCRNSTSNNSKLAKMMVPLMDGFERVSNALQIGASFVSIGWVLIMQHAFAGNNSIITSENIPKQRS